MPFCAWTGDHESLRRNGRDKTFLQVARSWSAAFTNQCILFGLAALRQWAVPGCGTVGQDPANAVPQIRHISVKAGDDGCVRAFHRLTGRVLSSNDGVEGSSR